MDWSWWQNIDAKSIYYFAIDLWRTIGTRGSKMEVCSVRKS